MSAISSYRTSRPSPSPDFFSRLPTPPGGGYAARLIAEMHGVLSDPHVSPGVARAAKRSLLLALERNRARRRPSLLVPALPRTR